MTAKDGGIALVGYDGKPLAIGDRIELHPGCDLWMQGARYGEIVGTSIDRVHVRLDAMPDRVLCGPPERFRSVSYRWLPYS